MSCRGASRASRGRRPTSDGVGNQPHPGDAPRHGRPVVAGWRRRSRRLASPTETHHGQPITDRQVDEPAEALPPRGAACGARRAGTEGQPAPCHGGRRAWLRFDPLDAFRRWPSILARAALNAAMTPRPIRPADGVYSIAVAPDRSSLNRSVSRRTVFSEPVGCGAGGPGNLRGLRPSGGGGVPHPVPALGNPECLVMDAVEVLDGALVRLRTPLPPLVGVAGKPAEMPGRARAGKLAPEGDPLGRLGRAGASRQLVLFRDPSLA